MLKKEAGIQELKESQEALRESEERFRNACDYAAIGMSLVGIEGRWLKVNQAVCTLLGYSEAELLATNFQALTHPDDLNADLENVKKLLAGTISSYQIEKRYIHKNGQEVRAQLNVSLVRDEHRAPLYFIAQLQDISQRVRIEEEMRASLREKEVLLKEIHHRVKNNMQIIVSMLYLQSTEIKDPVSIQLYKETQDRVKSMALIHEKLYQSPDLEEVDFHAYVDHLLEYLARSYGVDRARIQLDPVVDNLALNLDVAVPCGLILNELVSNSLKYAFPGGRAGYVRVSVTERDGHTRISVSDDGVGLPPGFKMESTGSLGLRLVSTLTSQINGNLSFSSAPGCTKFEVEFAADTVAMPSIPDGPKGLHE